MYQDSDPSLQQSFEGHKRPVISVTFNSSKKQVISGALDGTVLIHSQSPDHRPIRFNGHKEAVYSLAYDPVRGLVASAAKDKTIKIWESTVIGTKDGKATTIKGHQGAVHCISFSWDGRFLLSTSADKIAKVWNLPGQQCSVTLSGHTNWVRCGRLSSDAATAVTGSDDHTAKLWSLNTRQCIRTLACGEAGVNSLEMLSADEGAVAGCSDGSVQVWDLRSPDVAMHLQEHEAAVTSVSLHTRGDCVVSASMDGSLKLWDLRRPCLSYTMRAHKGAVLAAAFSADGLIASAGTDQRVLLWASNVEFPSGITAMSSPAATARTHKRGSSGIAKYPSSSVSSSPHGAMSIRRAVSLGKTTSVSRPLRLNSTTAVPEGYNSTGSLSAEDWKGWPAVEVGLESSAGTFWGATNTAGREPSTAEPANQTRPLAKSRWNIPCAPITIPKSLPEGRSALSSSLQRPALERHSTARVAGMAAKGVASDSRICEVLEKLTARLDALNSSVAALDRRVEHVENLRAPENSF